MYFWGYGCYTWIQEQETLWEKYREEREVEKEIKEMCEVSEVFKVQPWKKREPAGVMDFLVLVPEPSWALEVSLPLGSGMQSWTQIHCASDHFSVQKKQSLKAKAFSGTAFDTQLFNSYMCQKHREALM